MQYDSLNLPDLSKDLVETDLFRAEEFHLTVVGLVRNPWEVLSFADSCPVDSHVPPRDTTPISDSAINYTNTNSNINYGNYGNRTYVDSNINYC